MTGNDGNEGSAAAPLRTIQAAINRVPSRIAHDVTINVGAGTYIEAININKNFDALKLFVIQGTAWTAFAPTSGLATGTFTSALDNTATLTGAGWAVNGLKGKFLVVASGALSGQKLVIAGNTTDTIELAGNVSVTELNGALFSFAVPAVFINAPSGSSDDYGMRVSALGSTSIFYDGVFLKNLRLGGGILDCTKYDI